MLKLLKQRRYFVQLNNHTWLSLEEQCFFKKKMIIYIHAASSSSFASVPEPFRGVFHLTTSQSID